MICKPEVMNIRGHNNCWGFDSDLSFGEDTEMAERANKAGKKTGMVEQTILISDRRFRKKGVPVLMVTYVFTSIAITFGHKYRYSNKSFKYFE